MREIAIDTETWLIEPGLLAPRLVVMSTYSLFPTRSGDPRVSDSLIPAHQVGKWIEAILSGRNAVLIGHNIAYDLAVIAAMFPDTIPLIFQAYESRRIKDTGIRERLLYLAQGRLSFDPEKNRRPSFALDALAAERLGVDMSPEKEEGWRYRFAELDGVPISDWPQEAKDYAQNDAKVTYDIYQSQKQTRRSEGEVIAGHDGVRNETEQTCAAWALHLMSVWGLRTDPEQVQLLEDDLRPRVEQMHAKLLQAGLLKQKKDGTFSKDLQAIRERVAKAYAATGKKAPSTPKGSVSTSRDTLKQSGDQLLAEYGDETNCEKLLTTYLPVLSQGTRVPLNPSYRVLMESGRTSSFSPNIQNVPRAGGVREAYIPRPGTVFVAADYSTLELCALAQVCLELHGASAMADAISQGRDLHLDVAAQLLHVSYEEAAEMKKANRPEIKDARQLAKALNFGFPGGMGARSFVDFASATYGVEITEHEAADLRVEWLDKWPEMKLFFRHVSELCSGEECTVEQLWSHRHRGKTKYTAACNTFFQGLAADGAKLALFQVARECYVDDSSQPSALFGCRPVAFIHDEILMEVPEGRVHEAAERLCRVMRENMSVVIPDVPITVEAVAMRRWYKDAEPVFDPPGHLVCWEPPHV
jgi:DNA polymerase-1